MSNILTNLGGLSFEIFLQEYWQKKPLLIRNAFPEFEELLSPDELAGLALEEEIESRIVLEDGKDGPWEMRNGPFTDKDFAKLPDTKWTLLVQAVDQWLPQAKELMQQFHFLPSWRLDDLMVSYAPDGGSVGPHFDYYDVFLIQGHGKRRWQVGDKATDDSPRLEGAALKILSDFKATDEWILEPGDMLYLPSQYSHNGVALGDCMTYSVGFRAPSNAEIIDDLAAEVISHCKDHDRYTDSELDSKLSSSEIPQVAIDQVKNMLSQALLDDELIKNWFGRYMTTRKYPELDLKDSDDTSKWRKHLAQGGILERHTASRFAFIRKNDSAELYIDGEATPAELAFSELLCSTALLDLTTLSSFTTNEANCDLLDQLVEYGALFCD